MAKEKDDGSEPAPDDTAMALCEMAERLQEMGADNQQLRADLEEVRRSAEAGARDGKWAKDMLNNLQGPKVNVNLPVIDVSTPRGGEDDGSGGELQLWVNFNAGPTLAAFPGARVVE